jgi:hypothetical protein
MTLEQWRARAVEMDSLLKDALVFIVRSMNDKDPDVALQAAQLNDAIRRIIL